MMKRFSVLFVCTFLFCILGKAQNISKDSITGTWEIIDVTYKLSRGQDTEQKAIWTALANGLIKAKFIFIKDGSFSLVLLDEKIATMKDFKSKFKKAKWDIGKLNNEVVVGSNSDDYTAMRFVIKQEPTKLVFNFREDDVDFSLEVKKLIIEEVKK